MLVFFVLDGDLHKLYRLQQEHSDREPFDRYIKNSWFNWGVFLMRAGAIDDAIVKFDEVLDITSRDSDAKRARAIAARYQGRPRDAAFDTFASTLPMRDMGDR